jgi:poly-gamma-glutamate synthesis protein (capsule biosynthesis protein)
VLPCALAALALLAAPGLASSSPDTDLVADAVPAADGTAARLGLPQGRTLTIAATGEILPHPSVVQFAKAAARGPGTRYDFAPLFRPLVPLVSAADLAICHLEVPVAPAGTPLSGYPDFGIPAEVADGIHATGWDRCSTASNHANDRGSKGLAATLDALDRAHVGHSGTARTAHEASAAPLTIAHGVRVAQLAYTWGFNGTPVAKPWMANVIDPVRILADAARARKAGARVVIVSLHWGTEYQGVSADQRALAERLLASPDVDLIIGHGPHVLQPVERLHGKYVLFSVGNLVANQGASKAATYDGVVVTIKFTVDTKGRAHADAPHVHPTRYDNTAGVVRLVGPSPSPSLTRAKQLFGKYLDVAAA